MSTDLYIYKLCQEFSLEIKKSFLKLVKDNKLDGDDQFLTYNSTLSTLLFEYNLKQGVSEEEIIETMKAVCSQVKLALEEK